METVVHSPVRSAGEPQFLTDWGAGGDKKRSRTAGIISVASHVAAIAGLLILPKSIILAPRSFESQHLTPLIAPPTELTQPEPNKGRISKEVNMEALLARPRIQIPPSPRSTTRAAAPRLAIPTPVSRPAPPAPLPEPPKLQAAGGVPKVAVPGPQMPEIAPPPQIQAQEKPKLAFETPGGSAPTGPPKGQVAIPNTSVSEAIRTVVRSGPSGGLTVGDLGVDIGGIGEGINLPPSPGKAASALELLSDPQGVDFRPYLIRILSNVRRNWFAVMPESVKLGRRGRVAIQFAISRNGSVPKLVIATGSGTDALDRAAVAGISASNPFPPLPTEFKGDQIRLQFTFTYNMPTR